MEQQPDANQGAVQMSDVPHPAPIKDLWPGQCAICKKYTDVEPSIALFSAKRVVLERTVSGNQVRQKIKYEDIQEHPIRICPECDAKSSKTKRLMRVSTIPAILFACFIFIVFIDEASLMGSIGAGLVGGGIAFVSIWAFTPERISWLKSKIGKNIVKYREAFDAERDPHFEVFTHEGLMGMQNRSSPW